MNSSKWWPAATRADDAQDGDASALHQNHPATVAFGARAQPGSPEGDASLTLASIFRNFTETISKVPALSFMFGGNRRKDRDGSASSVDVDQRFFAAAIESSTQPFVAVNLDGTIAAWNRGAERLYGYTAAEAIGRSIDLIVPEERRGESRKMLEQMARGQPVSTQETVRINKAGQRLDVVFSPSAVRDTDGRLIGSSAIVIDVTEHKLTKELFRQAVEASPVAKLMIDEEGKIILVNAEIERLFGYSRDELVGESVDILVPDQHRGAHARHRADFCAEPETRRMALGRDLRGRHKNGREVPVEVALSPIKGPDGLITLAAVTDISERKHSEEIKDEFISTVSHEMRTPLTSIAGSLGLLIAGAGGELPEAAIRLLTIAQNNCERLVRLINDILDIEKIESGRMQFQFTRVDMLSLLEQAIDANRGFADKYGVRVTLATPAAPSFVKGDIDRLTQVVTNLLSNAIKFSPSGEEVVVAIEQGDRVRISVRDHGPGIPEAFKPQIFNKYAQAERSESHHDAGTGLGLNIVKKIVEQHHGIVGFDPAPGGGTIFYFELPYADSVTAGATTRRGRVLHIDDDRDLQGLVAEILRDDADVVAAASIQETRRALVNANFDLAVIDLALTDGFSVDLLGELRNQDGGAIPLVVFSGHQANSELASRAVAVLRKSRTSLDNLATIVRGIIADNAADASRPQSNSPGLEVA